MMPAHNLISVAFSKSEVEILEDTAKRNEWFQTLVKKVNSMNYPEASLRGI